MSIPRSYSVKLTDLLNPALSTEFSEVANDGILVDGQGNYIPYRFLGLYDGTRVEFPMDRYIVQFSPERAAIAEAQARVASQRKAQDANQAKMN